MTKVEVLKQAQEQVNDVMEDISEMKDPATVNAHARLFEACSWLSVSADIATMDSKDEDSTVREIP